MCGRKTGGFTHKQKISPVKYFLGLCETQPNYRGKENNIEQYFSYCLKLLLTKFYIEIIFLQSLMTVA